MIKIKTKISEEASSSLQLHLIINNLPGHHPQDAIMTQSAHRKIFYK